MGATSATAQPRPPSLVCLFDRDRLFVQVGTSVVMVMARHDPGPGRECVMRDHRITLYPVRGENQVP